MKSFLIAAGLAIVATLALLYSACHPHAGDSCYIMRGLAVYLAPALLILFWPLVAGIRLIIRAWNQPPPPPGQ